MSKQYSQQLLDRISKVSNKRARIVLDHILKNGQISTEELKMIGYEHPPRAARDVRELGFTLRTIKVKNSTGRSIGAYVLTEDDIQTSKSGRRLVPKKKRDALIASAGGRCQNCGAESNLQVDHRIPYEIAGETQAQKDDAYQIICGSCNRKKSWACEHCSNWQETHDFETCLKCYWASPELYEHIAMVPQRRVELVWTHSEVAEFSQIEARAVREATPVHQWIKSSLKNIT